MDIVQIGIDRPPFAADCLNVVMKELQRSATEEDKIRYKAAKPFKDPEGLTLIVLKISG